MSDDRMFERNARAWLELGPTTAPKKAVDAALLAIETTPQKRGLRAPWRFPQLTIQRRFAVAAAVALMVIGAGLLILRSPQSQIGGPSPSPTASPNSSLTSLEGLQGVWASVGTRDDPVGLQSNPPQVEAIAFDAAGLRINSFKGDITSSASIDGTGGPLTLRMEAPQNLLGRQNWTCTTGDTGSYYISLSSDGQTLTLTSAGDDCATRADILTGDWTRWSCPNASQYAYCDHVSELAPGRYTSPIFRPFGRGTSGQLAYTVPAGWADLHQPPTWPSTTSAARLSLATLAAPDISSVTVYSTLRPYAARAVPVAPLLDCPVAGLIAPVGTAAGVADWLESLPYLAISQRTPVTIGGLSGVQIDLSIVAGVVDPCSYGTVAGGSIEYSSQIQIFGNAAQDQAIYMDSGADDHARFIVLDTGDGQLVIALSAPGQTAVDALVAQAMPVIDAFEFIP